MTAVRTIADIALLVVGVALCGWMMWRALRRSDEPAKLVLQWILTAGIGAFMYFTVAPTVARGGYGGAFIGIPLTAVCGLVLAIIWRHSITDFFAKPFENLFTGGSAAPDPCPSYSPAIARRKRGKFAEAVAEIQKQLEKFPNDFEGLMMLAEIQACDLGDLAGAETTVACVCNQPDQAANHIAFALNSLADWHLKLALNAADARQALEKIVELLPGSQFAALAAQRIAHLPNAEALAESRNRRRPVVTEGVQNLGLLDPRFHPMPADSDAAREAAELVTHLHVHPLDTEARERLATIYAEHYHRLDLAADQMEQLISHSNQPPARIIRWLNVLADMQLRAGAEIGTVRATVQRVCDLFPESAGAHLARNRIARLPLEFKAKEKSRTVSLGLYEQDVGLKPKRQSSENE